MNKLSKCQKATFLIVKKEENKITLSERFLLNVHLLLCNVCAVFAKQSLLINGSLKSIDSKLNSTPFLLSETKKSEIENKLNDEMKTE